MIGRYALVIGMVCASSFAGSEGSWAQQPQGPATQPDVTAATAAAATGPAADDAIDNAAAPATAAAGPPAAAPAHPASAPTPVIPRDPSTIDMSKQYLIGPEDVLDIAVWKNCPDLCRTVPVRPDGKVSLPLVNDVQAAGLTPMDLRKVLSDQLAEYIPSPEVSVIVREVHNFKVAVMGSVKMPGDYEIKSQATVLELLARAQGLTEFANRDKIVVLRQNGNKTDRIQFNYRRVAEGHDQDNFYVRAGDVIVVP